MSFPFRGAFTVNRGDEHAPSLGKRLPSTSMLVPETVTSLPSSAIMRPTTTRSVCFGSGHKTSEPTDGGESRQSSTQSPPRSAGATEATRYGSPSGTFHQRMAVRRKSTMTAIMPITAHSVNRPIARMAGD